MADPRDGGSSAFSYLVLRYHLSDMTLVPNKHFVSYYSEM